jgi:hypothetical protein
MAIYNFGKVQETEIEVFDSICIAYVAYVSLCSLGRPNCIGERSDMLGWSKSGSFCRNDCVKVPNMPRGTLHQSMSVTSLG